MPVICIGPVCIPLHMVLAFLLGILHKWGYLKFIKQEWVTWRYWRDRWWGPRARPGKGGVELQPSRGSQQVVDKASGLDTSSAEPSVGPSSGQGPSRRAVSRPGANPDV
ncbi:hypothetical protein V8C86DRAFT_2789005, partial [Haematococcus lacustris]